MINSCRFKGSIPCEKPWLGLFFWAGLGTGLSLKHLSNNGRMTFLTPPMTLMGCNRTTYWPWAASIIHWATAVSYALYDKQGYFCNRQIVVGRLWVRLDSAVQRNLCSDYCELPFGIIDNRYKSCKCNWHISLLNVVLNELQDKRIDMKHNFIKI